MQASLYLTLAYLKPKKHLLSVMNSLAVAGTLLGVAVLIVVISVMNGFGDMWREKILSFQPHVTVVAYPRGMEEDDPLFENVAELPEVVAVAPFLQSIVMAQSRDAVQQPILQGIDPEQNFLFQKMREDEENTLRDGTLEFEEMECLIGVDLANALGVRAGDKLTVFSPANIPTDDEVLLPEELRIAGVFSVGMYQVDFGFILTDLYTAREVMGMDHGIHGMQIQGIDMFEANALAEKVSQMASYRYSAQSWTQMNQSLFDALTMEKSMMFFLLTIISIVASFTVSCTLIMVSVQKTREVGLLKSMGFRNSTIMGIFMWYGLIQGVAGIILGTASGLLVLHFRQHILDGLSRVTGLEILPKSLYYIDGLPSKVVPGDVAIIIGLVLVLCLVGGMIPAWLAARKNPVEALRHD
ncbi:ABC transporter permease [Kiritimatiellaeota bacterium B1221]|nr:ABC transporter permease [Kiritimatiellaeota bacterium B1221]